MTRQRLRLTYEKGDALKVVGHLDLVRTWERALRRAGVPLAYSAGFNPQARLQFASALPVGAAGYRELVDVFLDESMAADQFLAVVAPQLPAGLRLLSAVEAPLKGKSLQALLRCSEWQVEVQAQHTEAQMAAAVERLLEQVELPGARQRKGRTIRYDLRPLILALRYDGRQQPGWHRLTMTLRSEPSATGRPSAVVEALGLADHPARLARLRCLFAEETELG